MINYNCYNCPISICIPKCIEQYENCNMSSTGCPVLETTLFDIEDRENQIGGKYNGKST